jgi:hypothetical protein
VGIAWGVKPKIFREGYTIGKGSGYPCFGGYFSCFVGFKKTVHMRVFSIPLKKCSLSITNCPIKSTLSAPSFIRRSPVACNSVGLLRLGKSGYFRGCNYYIFGHKKLTFSEIFTIFIIKNLLSSQRMYFTCKHWSICKCSQTYRNQKVIG